ncbi:MAG: NfeD family protein [Ilumatobacteraceae bacterium]|jgi:membrane protein implicated in regulation of membrane protease activity|nr:NfeD family protein [Ilumatobacteraceae bacterium]MDP4706564.1 NfeD family protein [Ilumatobacteraceae bacterium]MDP4713148.1 NfeD family protein [Ilumatobacteraceae bacterium]MDP4936953.1 NfeD family protein [Ilumatobacteraceae bacterium]MDP4977685.1 NfeD family protein [Ilumatobacteraceae bacterium]
MPLWMWFGAAGVLLVVEMLTVDLLFASLAFSALLAAGASAAGFDVVVQGVVFGVGAVGSLLFLRPVALKHLKKKPADHATNVEALIGAPAIALTPVTENEGLVKLSGETWSARSFNDDIENGTRVEVVAIEGATAVVKRKVS